MAQRFVAELSSEIVAGSRFQYVLEVFFVGAPSCGGGIAVVFEEVFSSVWVELGFYRGGEVEVCGEVGEQGALAAAFLRACDGVFDACTVEALEALFVVGGRDCEL